MRINIAAALCVVPCLATAQVSAPVSDSLDLRGRSILSAAVGLTGMREASATATQTSAHATGQVASLTFTHFVRPSVAVEVAAAVLDAEASAQTTTTSADAITALLLGLNWSPRALALSPSVRPYVSAAAGVYHRHVGSATASSFFGPGVSASSESQAGGRFGAGVNFFVARHVALQVEGDYHSTPTFRQANATSRNPSGLSLSAGLAFAWGR